MQSYQYPDYKDRITAQMIQQVEPCQGYWGHSENRVLEILKEQVATKQGGAFLDAGCGEGRLLPVFQSYFSTIEAIEPDEHRFAVAREMIEAAPWGNKIKLQQTTLEMYAPGRQFDFVLCSHVLQHIPLENVAPFVNKLASLTAKDGIVAIMTNHSITNDETFVLSTFNEEGAVTEDPIEAKDFNAYVCKSGYLPIHSFTIGRMTEICTRAGLEVMNVQVFHILNAEQHSMNIDNTVNASPELQATHGRDMFFLLKKQ